MIDKNIIENYNLLVKELDVNITEIKKAINSLSYLRLGVFAFAVLLSYLFFESGLQALSIIFVLMLLAFLILVKKQVKKQHLFNLYKTKLQLVQNELDMINGNANIYNNGSEYQNQAHFYMDDLDVFGAHSIFAYINRCVSFKGLDLLANWLKKPSAKAEIEQRQVAVEELSKLENEILNFRTQLFSLESDKVKVIEYFFTAFLPKKLDFIKVISVIIFINAISVLNVLVFIIAAIYGSFFWSILGICLIMSAVGYLLYKKQIDSIHENIGNSVSILNSYADNIKWIENTNWQSQLLVSKVNTLKSDKSLHAEIAELAKILNSLNTRLNPIVGLFLNLFLQWDLRCLKRLAKWEQSNSGLIINGLNVVSEFEALISLAVLSNNHSAWINPKIVDSYHIKSIALGHPLIKEKDRIVNDFSLAQNITIDVITGSNMAGKSTFLRTLGVNMVLAFAGAKVCAKVFETSVFNILSYMRIKDSLSNQTSTFKAEIDRLKMILEHTKIDANSFVLIDEMLRGTNSRDKYLGSKVFIKKLIAQQTPGLIATHDLQIAELEKEFPQQLRNYHFDIQIKGEEMYFDYLMKDGECKTFNASILLKNIGLQID
ncbi:MutS-related protein [Pedobacter alpinus]|uniref:DNA mismatch repair protein MutS n=1 Tax=Pedobacter alpinus TaxID=1590643 RepID=A0ABW5TRV5_9SPHI